MSVQKDIQSLKEDLSILKRDMQFVKREMVTSSYLDEKLEALRLLISDRVLTTESLILGEIKAMREEFATGHYRQTEHSRQLENHEERLVLLESVH